MLAQEIVEFYDSKIYENNNAKAIGEKLRKMSVNQKKTWYKN